MVELIAEFAFIFCFSFLIAYVSILLRQRNTRG